jgi:prepilin signal peptidase PulO-like enzyme (type II secretory pathway)
MLLIELFLLAWLSSFAVTMTLLDLKALEIPEDSVLATTGFAILTGILFPLEGQVPDDAFIGAAAALALGTATRAYIHWRTGVAAFGGADIAILAGGGGLLGPELLGPWALVSSLLAGLGAALLPRFGFRKEDIDGTELQVLPFCPALLAGAAGLYIAARTGWISAQGLL